MRALTRLLALSILLIVCCAPSGALASVSLKRISGIPGIVVQSPSLRFSLDLRNGGGRTVTPRLQAWLSGKGSQQRLRLSRLSPLAPHQLATLPLSASVPQYQRAGAYTLILCASRHKLRKPPRRGCLRSRRFSLASSIPVAPGQQPTTATRSTDPSRAMSAIIGPAGGTISTAAADGSVLSLAIPAHALAGDELVSLSPLLTLGNVPLKLVAGAQLAPDGLRLLAPAQLTITPAHAVNPIQQVAFAYEGSGSQLGLVPLSPGAAIRIPVLRLGGAGLGQANGGQLRALIARPPTDPRAAWLQQLASAMRVNRLRALKLRPEGPRNAAAQARGVIGGYYNGYVEPTLSVAGSSLAAFKAAAQAAVGWERELELLGFSPVFGSQQEQQANALLDPALGKVWSAAVESCDGSDTLGQLQAALIVGRVAQSLGIDAIVGGDDVVQAGIQGCEAIPVTASLSIAQAMWRSGSSADNVAGETVSLTTGGQLQSIGPVGGNEFGFQSPHAPVSETMLSATEGVNASAAGCSAPTFVSFSSDPNQMYAFFNGKLTVPADLFDGTPPAWTFELGTAGADMASWTISCPPSMTPQPFQQAPGAMAGLTAVTGLNPVRLTHGKLSRSFQGSSDLLSGQTITAFSNVRGSASIKLPQ